MSIDNGPQVLQDDVNEPEVIHIEANISFTLSDQVSEDGLYTIITRLPQKETLEKLDTLSPFMAKQIKDCFIALYSHVTERKPNEGSDHYFVHVAASVHYEVGTQSLIKGRDHAKKAASTLQMIGKVIEEINKKLVQPIYKNQVETLTLFLKLLQSNQVAIQEALAKIPTDTKAHLKKHQNLDIEGATVGTLTPKKKAAIFGSYPRSPTLSPTAPKNARRTPKKLSTTDRESIQFLVPSIAAVRKQLFVESDDSSSEEAELKVAMPQPLKTSALNRFFVSASPSVDSGDDENFSWDEDDAEEKSFDHFSEEDDTDAFLSKQVDALVFSKFVINRPSRSPSTSPFHSPRKENKANASAEKQSPSKRHKACADSPKKRKPGK